LVLRINNFMSTKTCPKCNSNKIKRILFGEVDFSDPSIDRYYLKGCVVTCDCIWHCIKCHYEWGTNSGHYEKPEEEE